jgi:hypothetical protein
MMDRDKETKICHPERSEGSSVLVLLAKLKSVGYLFDLFF